MLLTLTCAEVAPVEVRRPSLSKHGPVSRRVPECGWERRMSYFRELTAQSARFFQMWLVKGWWEQPPSISINGNDSSVSIVNH